MEMGEYEVVGRREYNRHLPGAVFEARLDRGAEARAVARGDIRLLRIFTPAVPPGSFEFPDGWLPADPQPDHHEAPVRRLTRSREE